MPASPQILIFISYSHDSPEHIESTLELSAWLCQRGINCNIDQYEESPPEGWARWCRNRIIEADVVLVICTEKYERRFSGREKAGAGRGAKWEGAILSQELYESESNNNKFIPVVFSKDDLAFIPIELRGVTHYDVSTEGGRTQLYRRLTGQPLITKPDIGEVQILPARERKCHPEIGARAGIVLPRHENRIREFAGNYWREVTRLLVSLPMVLAVLNIVGFPIEGLIDLTITRMTEYWVLGVAMAILTLVSFPRVAEAITLTIRGPRRLASLENTIFRGPRSYGPHDHLPGRRAELEACQLRFRDKSFFILDGESGCGKSSFLNAVLLPQCRHTFRVVECRIADDPFGKLYDALLSRSHRKVDAAINEEQLASVLIDGREHESHDTAAKNVKPILICMDQFEELFVTVRDETRRRFFNVLRQAINTGSVRVLIAIRSDFRDLLDKACRDVDPEQAVLDAGNYYSLSAFRKEQAEDVLIELLAPLYSSNALFNKQLDDFSIALVNDLLRSPRDRRLSHLDQKTVLPVELQTVGMMIEQIGTNYFSAVGFREVGGKLGLLRRYIDDAKAYVWHRTGVPGDQSLLILRQLISPARTKWTQTAQSIGNACRIPAYKVEKVLEAFSARYLVSPVLDSEAADSGIDARTSLQYELMHEHLIQIITEAPNPVLQKARDAEERLSFWRQRAGLHLSDTGTWRFLNPQTQILFRMPIPLGESLRLLRFASIPADRLMLRHNLRGFTLRTLAAAVLILGPSLLWLYSPWGQIQLIRWDIANLKNGNDQDTLQVMAKGFASAGFLEQSLEVAARLDDPMEKANALRDMVKATARMGDANKVAPLLKQVLEVAAQLDDPSEKAITLRDMAEAIADLASEHKNTSWLNQALEAAARIDEASGKVRALCAVAQATAQMGDAGKAAELLRQALEVAARIDEASDKVLALSWVAQATAQVGDASKAAELLRQALEAAARIDEASGKVLALSAVARVTAQMGDASKAAELLKQVLEGAARLDGRVVKDYILEAVIAITRELGDEAKQAALLQQVLEMAAPRDAPISSVVKATAQMGDASKAGELLKKALEAAARIDEASLKGQAVLEVVHVTAQLASERKNTDLLNHALEVAARIDEASEKVWALCAVAQATAQTGDASKAAELLKQALKAAAHIDKGFDRAQAQRAVAEGTAKLASASKNTDLLNQALEVASGIAEATAKGEALFAVAQATAQMGDASKAAVLLKHAGEAATRMVDGDRKAEMLTAVAQAAAKLGYWRQARYYAGENTKEDGKARSLIAILRIWHGVDWEDAESPSSTLKSVLVRLAL